jgi:16S rRNA (cytosine1402-N4)-methyltransferase
MSYHKSVMLHECIEALAIKPEGIYIDVTFGGGGHSKAILEKISDGKLFSFDQDEDAAKEAAKIEHSSFTFIKANFRYLKKYLKLYGIEKVDGILADFGVSSHQFDTVERGFSYRFDGPLDMRMDRNNKLTAEKVINSYTTEQLQTMFFRYGEVTNAKKLAEIIIAERTNNTITTTEKLKAIVAPLVPPKFQMKYLSQVFQAIRIEVNEELKVIEEFLVQAPDLLNKEGRLVILTFHSLEDRLVKNFFNNGKFEGEVEKDIYGNDLKPLVNVNRKAIVATEQEIKENIRARSAKLRIAKKK